MNDLKGNINLANMIMDNNSSGGDHDSLMEDLIK